MMDIAIVNISNVVSDDEARHWVAAIQQFMPEFDNAWKLTSTGIAFVPKNGGAPLTGMNRMILADDSDQAAALGYHEDDASGVPIGYAFAKTCIRDGVSIPATVFHEVGEMRINPFINLFVALPDGRRFIKEVSDAVEADEDCVTITMPSGPNVLLSDFVLPSYFDMNAPRADFYDYSKRLTEPLPAMLPGGYLAYQDASGNWGQLDRVASPARRAQIRPHVLSRRYRAMFRTWQRSTTA